MTSYDAIVFHERNLNAKDLPGRRSPEQLYVHYNLEAPFHSNVRGIYQRLQRCIKIRCIEKMYFCVRCFCVQLLLQPEHVVQRERRHQDQLRQVCAHHQLQ